MAKQVRVDRDDFVLLFTAMQRYVMLSQGVKDVPPANENWVQALARFTVQYAEPAGVVERQGTVKIGHA
jgi:hypothetical protein